MGKVKSHKSQPFEFESSGALKVDQQPKKVISKRESCNALNINDSIGDAKSIQTNKEITISPRCCPLIASEDDGTMNTGSDVMLRSYKKEKEAPAGINIIQHD